jgi:creatinine amidohydrolase
MGYSIFDETIVDMTWPEIEKAIQENAIVLLPVGVIEEHGPHISLAVDIYMSYMMSKIIKHELEKRGTPTQIAPPYYWGINTLTGVFPGSFNVRPSTMKAVLQDILASLRNWGVANVFIINWHGEFDHNTNILEGIKEARAATAIKAYYIVADYEAKAVKFNMQDDCLVVLKSPPPRQRPSKYLDLHAGALETGMMLNYFPEQVKKEMLKSLEPTKFTIEDLKAVRHGGGLVRKYLPSGYFGAPADFDLESSQQYTEGRARDFAIGIESVLKGHYRPPEF